MRRSFVQLMQFRAVAIPALWLLLCFTLLLGISGLAPHTHLKTAQPETIETGHAYAIRTIADRCTFDLEFNTEDSYVLIISSLGNPLAEHRVELSCKPIDKRVFCPVNRVADHQQALLAQAGAPGSKMPDQSAADQLKPHSIPSNQSDTNPLQRSYALHVTDGALDDPKQYTTIHASRIASGPNVHVFLDNQMGRSQIAPGVAKYIVQQLERQTIPHLKKKLGQVCDVDNDAKLTVLLTPWLERLQGGKTALGGMVRSADFNTSLPAPFSNHADILYLNSNVRPGAHLQTLLMHELTHAVCISERTAQSVGYAQTEEDWLNEALAHVMEIHASDHWSNLDYRISRFLNHTERYPLVIPNYYQSGLWRNHGCRGATFLFLQWCLDQYGETTLPRLVKTTRTGTENISAATGTSFATLFRLWTLSLLPPQFQNPEAAPAATAGTTRIYEPLDNWNLTGPNFKNWYIGNPSCSLRLRGTSAAFMRLQSSTVTGPQRISIQGSPGSELQITILKRDHTQPQLDILEQQFVNDCFQVRMRLTDSDRDADAWTASAVSFECNQDDAKESYCFTRENILSGAERFRSPGFQSPGIRSPGKESKRCCLLSDPENAFVKEFELAIPVAKNCKQAEWTVKVIGKTKSGVVMTARATTRPALR